MTIRKCLICLTPIKECFGSVLAGPFLLLLYSKNTSVPIPELCSKCASKIVLKSDIEELKKKNVDKRNSLIYYITVYNDYF